MTPMTQQPAPQVLELDDIQGAILRQFPMQGCTGGPMSYAGSNFVLRIDDPKDGREMLRRLIPYVASAVDTALPVAGAEINVALSYRGLAALGVPQPSLDSFPQAFKEGMAARAEIIGDVGESAPANWEAPFGTADVHVAITLVARDEATLESAVAVAQMAQANLPGVTLNYRLDVARLPTGRTHFGYVDGIGQPWIEGSPTPGSPGETRPIKAGEFILGYPDATGQLPPLPQPDILGRNGTFVALRKLHERVAAFRQFLRDNAPSPADEPLLAAKLLGRWPSGAPLAVAPDADDPALATDPRRNDDFGYGDDRLGLKCPIGAHIRRANPRDSLDDQAVDVGIHRIVRRGGSYGPVLPKGVLEDDGVDRGIIFFAIGTSLTRQFEFVLSQWLNDGNFVGLDAEKDAIAGANDGTGTFTIPQRPIRRRLDGVPRFVVTRGGEYCFVPSLKALGWLANLDT